MRISCAHCGEDLAADDWCTCRAPLSNFAAVVLTAAALDTKREGPIDGEALRVAAVAMRGKAS